MDILNALRNPSGTFVRGRIPAPEVTTCVKESNSEDEMETDEDEEDIEKNTAIYAEDYKRQEYKMYETMSQKREVILLTSTFL